MQIGKLVPYFSRYWLLVQRAATQKAKLHLPTLSKFPKFWRFTGRAMVLGIIIYSGALFVEKALSLSFSTLLTYSFSANRPLPPNPGIVFPRVFIGALWEKSVDPNDKGSSQPRILRKLLVYADEHSSKPLREIPEINTIAGARGPVFMVGNYDLKTGEILYSNPVYLEVLSRTESEPEYVPMKPRVKLDPRRKFARPVEMSRDRLHCYLGLYSVLRSYRGEQFDSIRWKQADPIESRYQMLEDLLNKHEFYGMRKSEVVDLLGEPAPPGFPYGASGWDMVYKVGWCGIDHMWLFLKLVDGRVDQIRLYAD